LPQDYLELITRCEGLVIGEWAVLGLSQTYEVVLPEGHCYVLADRMGKATLVIRAHANDELLIYDREGGGDPVIVGHDLASAIVMQQLAQKGVES